MENGSSFEKNMREKFQGFSEEPGSHVWENVLSEIEKPQSVSEIIFPWAGPGLDLLVAILLIFQINIPSIKMAQPVLVKNIQSQSEKFISNQNKTFEESKHSALEPSEGSVQIGTGEKINFASNLSFQQRNDGYLPTEGNLVKAAGEGERLPDLTIQESRTNAEISINHGSIAEREKDSQNYFEKTLSAENGDSAQRLINPAQEGIVRVGLAPANLLAKKNLVEIQGKGLTLTYMTPAELNILPEDYSSGNPFRAENSKPWLLDLYYSPSLGFSRIKESKAEVKNSYLQIRDSSESPVYYGSFGLLLGRKINRFFYFAAGIQYSVRQEKFSGVYQWDEPELRVDSIVHDKVINSTVPKVVVVEYDTVVLSSRKSKLLNHQVKFQTWEIPIRTGIRFDKENIVFSLQAGVIASWRTKVSGNILEPVLMEEMKIQPGIERQFLMSGTFSAGVEWKLSNHLSIIAEPQYRYYFNSPYSGSFPLNIQWQSVSLLTGMRIRL